MPNKELIDLCRLVIAAIQESDAFDAMHLKKLLLHIVPQLLAELDIMQQVLEMLRPSRTDIVVEAVHEMVPQVMEKAPDLATVRRQKKSARKHPKKRRRK